MAPTRNNKRKASTKHLVRSIHRVELGNELRPTVDPPTWVSAPWWPLTITATAKKPASYTTVTLHALALKCLGLDKYVKDGTETPRFRLRYVDVRIWGLERQPITLNIPRLNSIGTRIKQLNDRGTPTRYSRLGWRYGMDSELALDYDDLDVVFEVQGDVNDTNPVLIYLRVLLQITGVAGAAAFATRQAQELSLPDGFIDGFVHLNA